MRRQGFMTAMTVAALLGAGTAPGVGGIPAAQAQVSSTTGNGGTSATTVSFAAASRRSMGYFGSGPGGFYGLQPTMGWRKRPYGSVARDKRNARKRRNQLRNKR